MTPRSRSPSSSRNSSRIAQIVTNRAARTVNRAANTANTASSAAPAPAKHKYFTMKTRMQYVPPHKRVSDEVYDDQGRFLYYDPFRAHKRVVNWKKVPKALMRPGTAAGPNGRLVHTWQPGQPAW